VRTSSRVYLHSKYEQIPKESSEEKKEDEPTKLAIGVDGGFDMMPKYTVTKVFQLFVLTQQPNPDDIVGSSDVSRLGEFIPLPFVEQKMAKDLPARVVHDECTGAEGHLGMEVPEFVRNICLEVVNHDGMSSRMQVS
jgi:hypothetical protein